MPRNKVEPSFLAAWRIYAILTDTRVEAVCGNPFITEWHTSEATEMDCLLLFTSLSNRRWPTALISWNLNEQQQETHTERADCTVAAAKELTPWATVGVHHWPLLHYLRPLLISLQ